MIDYEKRAMTEEEDKYTFTQSAQISSQTGLIGHLRADMDTDGNGFFSTWFGYRDDLKTDEFKAEFDEVVNSLREEGDILHDRGSLARYCNTTPQSRMTTQHGYYGVRVDTERYAYLFRLNPNKGEYNVYCYCYRRDWLDTHIRNARRGIRFITPHYKEIFRIPDGDRIRVTMPDGESFERVCRYIDDYHIEAGESIYHICEFAERMEKYDCKLIPLRSNLPDLCYAVHNETGKIIVIKKGETGYFDPDFPYKNKWESKTVADEYNEKLGVSKQAASAMYWGSLYGFDTPGADPANYDHNGDLLKKTFDRGDAR